MILNCPACSARFLVADSLVPSEGRTVRCGACSHQWFVQRPEDAQAQQAEESAVFEPPPPPLAESTEEQPIADDFVSVMEKAFSARPVRASNVPAIPRKPLPAKPFKLAVPILAVLCIFTALIAYYPNWQHTTMPGALYRALGFKDTQGLAFTELKMERENGDTKTKFIFSGTITNNATAPRYVPQVRVALRDKHGKDIWMRDYPVNMMLDSGGTYPFRIVNVETSLASSVAVIVLDIGNGLELKLR